MGFELVSMTREVARNETASVTIRTVPAGSCDIVYITPAGTPSNASGLDHLQAGEDGLCTWSWVIGPSTIPGTGTITIVANGVTRNESIQIE